MDCQSPTSAWKQLLFCTPLLITLPPLAHADTTQPFAASPVTATAPASAQPTPIVRAFRNDAALNHVAFANPSSGWAVGDRGVIWHTDDGGASWHQQPSPISCSLNAAFFLDGRRGWAVGGHCQPYSDATRGVVLRTDDGGATWLELPQSLLPLLTGVKFFDREHGIAYGESASYYPSGVFDTRDGGATWQPLPAEQSGNWLAGDFLEPDAGAVAGPAGQIATLVRRKVVASPLAASSLRSFRAMQLVAPVGGWAVGDGGLLLTTNDLGHSWQTPLGNLPQAVADQFNFHALAVEGPNVWVAGSPGTRIFHSSDEGKSWQAVATGQTAPLRAMRFIDTQHGWAAGDFGNILATHDGGRSWQTQHTGAQRAALLAIFANPTDVPLELLADSGAADGYITAVDILCTSAEETGATGSYGANVRGHEALLLSGAATANTAWRFPLPPADLALAPNDLLAALNRENDGRALQQLESHLVRELRMWRPDIVVTHHVAQETTAAPVAALIEQLVSRCVIAAADSTQHPALASVVGLAPWQVKKVYGLAPPGMRGDESLETARFSPWLGATRADFTSPARSLLFTAHTPPPSIYELKLLKAADRSNSSEPASQSGSAHLSNARGIFSGIFLAPGSEARRRQPDLPVQDLDALRRLATRRRNLQQLLDHSEGNTAWAAQIDQLLDGLSDDDAGQLLVQLAESYRKTGRLDLAADTYFLFARRTPDHPLVDPALTWLVQFYSSSEIAHHVATHASTNLRRPAPAGEPALAGGEGDAPPQKNHRVRQATALTPIASGAPPDITLSPDDRLRRAIQLANYLKTARPALYAEPAVRFAEVTAQRKLGYANPAKRFFLALRQLPESDPWRQSAAAEEWLEKPGTDPPPKKLASCRPADRPPHLDGYLDEPFWNTADRLSLRDSNSPPPSAEGPAEGRETAEIRLAHDNQFLYIAIHCPKAANLNYQTDDTARPRDADLTQHDRVSLRFDVDRDYTTAFELTVDHRGWTHDALWGDATWNPTWYVAAASDETSWTIEAALPLAELVDQPPAARDVWAVAARRTIPRTGYQSWGAATTRGEAAAEDSPAPFGLLIFE